MKTTLHMPSRSESLEALGAAVEAALGDWDGYFPGHGDLDDHDLDLANGYELDKLLSAVRDNISALGYEMTPQADIQRGLEGFEDKVEIVVEAETDASFKARARAEDEGYPAPDPKTRVYCWSFPIPEDS